MVHGKRAQIWYFEKSLRYGTWQNGSDMALVIFEPIEGSSAVLVMVEQTV